MKYQKRKCPDQQVIDKRPHNVVITNLDEGNLISYNAKEIIDDENKDITFELDDTVENQSNQKDKDMTDDKNKEKEQNIKAPPCEIRKQFCN